MNQSEFNPDTLVELAAGYNGVSVEEFNRVASLLLAQWFLAFQLLSLLKLAGTLPPEMQESEKEMLQSLRALQDFCKARNLPDVSQLGSESLFRQE